MLHLPSKLKMIPHFKMLPTPSNLLNKYLNNLFNNRFNNNSKVLKIYIRLIFTQSLNSKYSTSVTCLILNSISTVNLTKGSKPFQQQSKLDGASLLLFLKCSFKQSNSPTNGVDDTPTDVDAPTDVDTHVNSNSDSSNWISNGDELINDVEPIFSIHESLHGIYGSQQMGWWNPANNDWVEYQLYGRFL